MSVLKRMLITSHRLFPDFQKAEVSQVWHMKHCHGQHWNSSAKWRPEKSEKLSSTSNCFWITVTGFGMKWRKDMHLCRNCYTNLFRNWDQTHCSNGYYHRASTNLPAIFFVSFTLSFWKIFFSFLPFKFFIKLFMGHFSTVLLDILLKNNLLHKKISSRMAELFTPHYNRNS